MTKPGMKSSGNRDDFWQPNLVGKTIGVTANLNGAGCGCNVAFYTVAMPGWGQGSCQDWYCDANAVCGMNCSEMDLIEMNQYAMHTTTHSAYDGGGFGTRFGQGSNNFAPGGEIDTNRPFRIENHFDESGTVTVTITQGGNKIQNSYGNGNVIYDDMRKGMVLTMSFWSAHDMGWLDNPPCSYDDANCPGNISFTDIRVDGGAGPTPPSPVPGPTPGPSSGCCSWAAGCNECSPTTDYCESSKSACENDCHGCWYSHGGTESIKFEKWFGENPNKHLIASATERADE